MPRFFRAAAPSPELRAGVFHSTVFFTNGVGAVAFAIWLSSKSIPSEQIGIINAFPMLLMLASNYFVGKLADRANDWRTAILMIALIGGGVSVGLFFVNEFWGVLLVWALCALSSGSVPPIIDAATLRMAQRNGSDFGTIRAWGTIGYMVASIVTGLFAARYGAAVFVPLFVCSAMLRAFAAFQLPRFRAPARLDVPVAGAGQGASRLREVLKPWFVLPLVAWGLVQITHAILSLFAALLWKQQGISEGAIGPLIAVGAAAEASMMLIWRRLGWSISARHMLLVSAAVTAVRWTITAFDPPLPILFLLQLGHAFTYTIGYFGLMHFIAKWTSEDIAAEAQGFALMVQQMMTVLGMLAFGFLADAFGLKAFLFAALCGVLAAGCVLFSLRLQPSH